MNKTIWILGILFLIIIIWIIYHFHTKHPTPTERISKTFSADGEDKILTYRLPTSMDTEIFGPPFWSAIHSMASEVPCSICRNEWESFTSFGHDYVNFKLNKPIFSEENFSKWLKKLCDIKEEREKTKSEK